MFGARHAGISSPPLSTFTGSLPAPDVSEDDASKDVVSKDAVLEDGLAEAIAPFATLRAVREASALGVGSVVTVKFGGHSEDEECSFNSVS